MAGLATKESQRSVQEFIDNITNDSKKEDSKVLLDLIQRITGKEPKVWGNEKVPFFIIGFGKYSYSRKKGKEVFEWFNVGFAPRNIKLTLYLNFDLNEETQLLNELGKCKWGKGCLYINKLKDIKVDVLEKLIEKSKEAKWH